MDGDVLAALLSLLIFGTYVIGLLLAAWKLLWLYVGYRMGIGISRYNRFPFFRFLHVKRTRPPFLLLVVIVFVASLAWPWVLLFGVRVLSQVIGIDTSGLSGNIGWYLLTGVPPDAGVLWFCWVVYRKIERSDKGKTTEWDA